jgi:hypothetical protein
MRRRHVLAGLGGFTLALPVLEYFVPKRAHAAPIPKRYAFLFGGFSIGSSGTDRIAPATEVPLEGNLTRALQPLGERNVTDVVSLVSGLEIPVGVTAPPAGRIGPFHSSSHMVLSTGHRYEGNYLAAQSSDWFIADQIGQGTLQPNLVYRAQPAYYRVDSDGGKDGTISARINGTGQLEQVPPLVSPRVAFESLFSGFVPPDPAQGAEAARKLALRKSVVDLVADDAGALIKRLGKADKLRMQRHFDELRSLETRLDQITLPEGPTCQLPGHPGDDPPIGDAIDPSGGGDYASHFENANGYSNEQLRAEVMTDLIHMAFACDISRVSSFMLTFAQCFMNMYPALGLPSDLHEITHGSIGENQAEVQDALADCAAWHIDHFARLVEKLRDSEEVDGSSLLDHTALVLAFEGGWGFDLEAGTGNSPHSTENMVMLVGGRAGGLHQTPGRHIQSNGKHPAAVLNTMVQAVGATGTLGEVSDDVPELLG